MHKENIAKRVSHYAFCSQTSDIGGNQNDNVSENKEDNLDDDSANHSVDLDDTDLLKLKSQLF